jgi:mannose-6-phosphate isomerase-like protein (cupin superfamily)
MEMKVKQIENSFSKERFTFLQTASETKGAVFVFEQAAPPDMIAPPVHLHIGQAEHFEVLEGEMTVQTCGQQTVVCSGESYVVQPGVGHTWWNSGSNYLRVRAEFRPAGNMQSFFETFCGLAQEGRSDKHGQPPLLQIAASEPLWGIYLSTPPIVVQRLVMMLLRPIAWLRGYRASYKRFE